MQGAESEGLAARRRTVGYVENVRPEVQAHGLAPVSTGHLDKPNSGSSHSTGASTMTRQKEAYGSIRCVEATTAVPFNGYALKWIPAFAHTRQLKGSAGSRPLCSRIFS